jgi:hypothetical protein
VGRSVRAPRRVRQLLSPPAPRRGACPSGRRRLHGRSPRRADRSRSAWARRRRGGTPACAALARTRAVRARGRDGCPPGRSYDL